MVLGQLRSFICTRLIKRYLFIHSESTPNPDSRKFIPEDNGKSLYFFNSNSSTSPALEWKYNHKLSETDNVELIYNSSGITPSKNLSSLVKDLLKHQEITRIFIGLGFLTATRADSSINWTHLSPKITSIIDKYFLTLDSLDPEEEAPLNKDTAGITSSTEDDEISGMVKELLDTKIRPYVQSDGGDIAFVSCSNGIVKVKLHGACTSCASSSETLKRGVASMMKYYIPEVMDVIDVTEESEQSSVSLEAFEELEKGLQQKHGKNK